MCEQGCSDKACCHGECLAKVKRFIRTCGQGPRYAGANSLMTFAVIYSGALKQQWCAMSDITEQNLTI